MKEAPDKIYTDNRGVYAKLPIFSQIDANIEYIRKDKVLNRIKTEWPMAWEKVVGKEEWSEEDEAMRNNIIRVLSTFVGTVECDSNPSLSSSYPTYLREIDWLKSLRPSWKPSNEQQKEPDKSLEEAAEEHAKSFGYMSQDVEFKENIESFIEGAEWQASQMPMPEDTVLFQKGVAEGRRLEREDMMKDISNILAPDDPATNEEIKKRLQELKAMIEKEVQRRVFNEVEHCWEEAHHEGYIEGWNECEAAYK